MENKRQTRFSPPAVGGVSLLVVFAVLSLTVFALLSLSTVRADQRLSEASAQAVRDYYAADCAAQAILARLRQGERPAEVAFSAGGLESAPVEYAEYAVPISDTQELQVQLLLTGADYEILRWQAAPAGEWDADEGLELWDGVPF